MAKSDDRIQRGILGDINPEPNVKNRRESASDHGRDKSASDRDRDKDDKSMFGGSRHDRAEHSGSRDVTEG